MPNIRYKGCFTAAIFQNNQDRMPTEIEAKKGRNFRSLTVTLAVAFLTLSLAVLMIASSLEIYFNLQTQEKVVDNQLQLIAENSANTVESFIQEKFSILEATASLSNLGVSQQGQQKLVMDKLLGLEPSFRQIILLEPQGQELARVSRMSNLAPSEFSDESMSDMLSQLGQGKTYISPVYIDGITSEPMVIMAVPVTNVFGDLKGVLAAEVNLKFMWDLVGRIKIGDSGFAYVIDRDGDLLAFGDISRVLKGEKLSYLDEVNEFVHGNEQVHNSQAETSIGIKGISVVTTHVHLENPDWAVVVELPVQEAYQSVTQGIIISALIMLLSLFLAIVAGTYLSRRITKPIIRLRDASVKIGEGKLDTQIEIVSKNEIGDLARAFSQMIEDLKKSRAKLEQYSKDLEKQVTERTKELKSKMDELERFNRLAVGRELRMIELKKRIKELEGKSEKKVG
jgi:methyl-accepting chemotaxis protein